MRQQSQSTILKWSWIYSPSALVCPGTRPGDECPEYAPKRDFKGSDSNVFFTVSLIVLNRTVGPVRDWWPFVSAFHQLAFKQFTVDACLPRTHFAFSDSSQFPTCTSRARLVFGFIHNSIQAALFARSLSSLALGYTEPEWQRRLVFLYCLHHFHNINI